MASILDSGLRTMWFRCRSTRITPPFCCTERTSPLISFTWMDRITNASVLSDLTVWWPAPSKRRDAHRGRLCAFIVREWFRRSTISSERRTYRSLRTPVNAKSESLENDLEVDNLALTRRRQP